jgi:hypothetical protein
MPATPYPGVNRHSRMYAPRPAHASFFRGFPKVFATQKLAASIIRMREGSMGCAIRQKMYQGKRPRTSIASVTRLTAST